MMRGMMSLGGFTMPTIQIVVRHSRDCKDRNKGAGWGRCDCSKSLVVYDPASRKNIRISCKTRSWEKAEEFAKKYGGDLDPEKQELKRLRAVEQQKQTRIEDAVTLYLTDMAGRH